MEEHTAMRNALLPDGLWEVIEPLLVRTGPVRSSLQRRQLSLCARFQPLIEFLTEHLLHPVRYRSCELQKLAWLEMCNKAYTVSMRRIVEQEKVIGHFPYFRQLP